MELLHEFYANMTKSAMPHIHGIIVAMFDSFGFYAMDVTTTIEMQNE